MNFRDYNQTGNYKIEEVNVCPICNVAMHPDLKGVNRNPDQTFLILWGCTNRFCGKYIAIEYKREQNPAPHPAASKLLISRILNGNPIVPAWPEVIQDLKSGEGSNPQAPPKFVECYLQSLKAEYSGLNELAGMGYRKTIEYLVKDWSIQNNPSAAEEIKKMMLMPVIKKYFTGDLKDILERATWLGNDETHYIRLFDEFDINTLKELIGLVISDLDREFRKQKYIATMQGRKA